jgi:hypothetical protein
VSRDSVVGIATRFELDSLGSNPGRETFPAPSRPALGPTQPPIHDTGLFPGVKRSLRGFNRPPSSSAKFTERLNLYFYSPSVSSWQAVVWPLLSYCSLVFRYLLNRIDFYF